MGRNTGENFKLLFKVDIANILQPMLPPLGASPAFSLSISQSQSGLVLDTLNRESGDLSSGSGPATR